MVARPGDEAVPSVTVTAPRIEYGVMLGTGESRPRLSWTTTTTTDGWTQERYQLCIWRAGSPQTFERDSPEQVFVDWPADALESRERIDVAVRVGGAGHWSAWSDRATAEVGLLHRSDWSAAFISPSTYGGMDAAAPALSTEIALPSAPVRARLYVTAKGIYEFSVNGGKVGTDVLTPGWTAYDERLRYQTYDVTGLLSSGSNVLTASLGNGWYRGQLVWPGNRASYGSRLALLAQLEVTYADGTSSIFATDETWVARESGILFDDLYDGQLRDMRDIDSTPEAVVALDEAWPALVAPTAPAVCVTEVVTAVTMLTTPTGRLIVDFGQNLVGWVRLTVRNGSAGQEVRIRHAEVLEDGELGVRPLRSAKATSTYILAGSAEEVLVPTFTFHGFRYAEITGIDGVSIADVQALVIGSGLRRTGWFESSNEQLNQLHRNIVWSMRGNFLDIPTDCPARDERLGWTGDIQVFAPTANYLFDTSGFLAGWLAELAAEQKPDGGVPNVVPDVLRQNDPASAGWGDAAAIVPVSLHTAFGDRGVLARQYDSMVAWVRKVEHDAGPRRIWVTGGQFGDWLDPTAPPEMPSNAQADPGVVATAHFARSSFLVARVARLLGRTDDAAAFEALHREIVAAFNDEYVSPDGTILSDCQTVYALALNWNLLDSAHKTEHASARLAELVRAADFRVSTGFLGTPLILDALEIAGYPHLALRMLLQDQLPSWLYAVGMGATTIWERWDSMLPDGSVNPGEMTSFNHYAYGAVADWMHRSIAGLAAVEPGYRRIRVRPIETLDLTSAATRHDSPYGTIEVSWERANDQLTLVVAVPVGVTAEIWMPGAVVSVDVANGVHTFTAPVATLRSDA